MHQNVLHLDGTTGTLILAGYVIGGLIAVAAGFLPGNAPRFRILCVVVGLGLSAWAAKVFLFGGTILLNRAILALPVTLTVAAIIGTYRAYRPRRTTADLAPLRPHPAARTFTEPAPFPLTPTFTGAVPVPAHLTSTAAHAAQLPAPRTPAPAAPSAVHTAPSTTRAASSAVHAASSAARTVARTQSPSAGNTQARFHGHAIAPPAAFPTPPRFAPQPLHNVPSPRPAPEGFVTVHAQYPANHLQPSSPHPSSHSMPAPHSPARTQAQTWQQTPTWQHPTWQHPTSQHPTWRQDSTRPQDSSWLQDAVEGQRVSVPRRHDTTMTPAHAVAPPTRMPLAPVTDPTPLQPPVVRARHRAAGSTA